MNTDNKTRCPMCESATLIPKKAVEHYHYKGQDFSLENIEYAACPVCQSEVVMPEQIKRNEARIRDEHRKIDGFLPVVKLSN
jgi:YgiT-type zinc finger domain-containing protein